MTPIRDPNAYPPDWKERRALVLRRARNRCEFCGVDNYRFIVRPEPKSPLFRYVEREHPDAVKIILTIAHMDHLLVDHTLDNLKALCQRCHLTYDGEHNRRKRKKNEIGR